MLAGLPKAKRELFRSDQMSVRINLNENFRVPNRFNPDSFKSSEDHEGVDPLIIAYRNRYDFPISNPTKIYVTYKFYE